MKNKTKNRLRIIVAVILFCITVFVGIYTHSLFKLGFFKNHSNIEINELTKQQKIDDIKYLINFVNVNSPYVDFIHSEKRLKNIHNIESDLIQKAANSKNNREYLEVVLEYLMILQQIGHAGLLEISKKPNGNFDYWPMGLGYDLPAKSFYYQYYWNEVSKQINSEKKWYHNELNIRYESGYYKIGLNNLDVPEESIIRSIDNLDVDSFVYNHWTSYILRFDTRLRKSFSVVADPLITNNDTTKERWTISLTTPLNENIIVNIPKLDGFKQRNEISNFDGNIKCVNLAPNVAYIKIKSFVNYPQYLEDFSTIDSFLNASEGKIKKLIIDVRNNRGGAPKYWQKMFVERFIKKEQRYFQYAAVKKNAYSVLKERPFIHKSFSSKDITLGKSERILLNDIPFDIKKHNLLNDKEWCFFKNTMIFTPKKTFQFNGELFLIVDNDCFSATEDFARAVKQLKLMTIVGANTFGGAAVISEPWLFKLPYSHMIIRLEIQMAFNSDGSINSIYGTEPDIRLDNHQFPTPTPKGYEKKYLLQDNWIKYILN